MTQLEGFERFPKTRYAGSKRKLLGALAEIFGGLEFETAADPFCGTGSVSYLLKTMGKGVWASDALEANVTCARALVENSGKTLGRSVNDLLRDLPDPNGIVGFVEETFRDVFFEDGENRFIDQVLPRIHGLNGYARDLALFALFQACLAKRPYNLFHRANLSMRRRDVPRSFGNKATWDTPFDEHMRSFAAQADRAVIDTGVPCRATRIPVEEASIEDADLVYLDPPYVSTKGAGVDYLDHYHFLEGLCRPDEWPERILHRYKHKPLAGKGESPWSRASTVTAAFEAVVARCVGRTLVVSYRSDGIPSLEEIEKMMKRSDARVRIHDLGEYVYALSRNRKSREVVLVGTPRTR